MNRIKLLSLLLVFCNASITNLNTNNIKVSKRNSNTIVNINGEEIDYSKDRVLMKDFNGQKLIRIPSFSRAYSEKFGSLSLVDKNDVDSTFTYKSFRKEWAFGGREELLNSAIYQTTDVVGSSTRAYKFLKYIDAPVGSIQGSTGELMEPGKSCDFTYSISNSSVYTSTFLLSTTNKVSITMKEEIKAKEEVSASEVAKGSLEETFGLSATEEFSMTIQNSITSTITSTSTYTKKVSYTNEHEESVFVKAHYRMRFALYFVITGIGYYTTDDTVTNHGIVNYVNSWPLLDYFLINSYYYVVPVSDVYFHYDEYKLNDFGDEELIEFYKNDMIYYLG